MRANVAGLTARSKGKGCGCGKEALASADRPSAEPAAEAGRLGRVSCGLVGLSEAAWRLPRVQAAAEDPLAGLLGRRNAQHPETQPAHQGPNPRAQPDRLPLDHRLSADLAATFHGNRGVRKKHGHCNVPKIYPRNQHLGYWVNNLRSLRKEGKLDRKTVRRLDDLGFCWSRLVRRFHRRDLDELVTALAALKKKHRALQFPRRPGRRRCGPDCLVEGCAQEQEAGAARLRLYQAAGTDRLRMGTQEAVSAEDVCGLAGLPEATWRLPCADPVAERPATGLLGDQHAHGPQAKHARPGPDPAAQPHRLCLECRRAASALGTTPEGSEEVQAEARALQRAQQLCGGAFAGSLGVGDAEAKAARHA